MKKLFLWPFLILLIHLIFYLSFLFSSESNLISFGFAVAGVGILDFYLIATLVAYIPLITAYLVIQKIRNKKTNLIVSFGLGVVSLFLGSYLLKYQSMLWFVNAIYISDLWRLHFR